jgi:isoaspartyl peptidase/L-asparaginase-like protein (Ntn-hydrolase superfamily)
LLASQAGAVELNPAGQSALQNAKQGTMVLFDEPWANQAEGSTNSTDGNFDVPSCLPPIRRLTNLT